MTTEHNPVNDQPAVDSPPPALGTGAKTSNPVVRRPDPMPNGHDVARAVNYLASQAARYDSKNEPVEAQMVRDLANTVRALASNAQAYQDMVALMGEVFPSPAASTD